MKNVKKELQNLYLEASLSPEACSLRRVYDTRLGDSTVMASLHHGRICMISSIILI